MSDDTEKKWYVISDSVQPEWDEILYFNLLMRMPAHGEDDER